MAPQEDAPAVAPAVTPFAQLLARFKGKDGNDAR
jgi:hypothetical protein